MRPATSLPPAEDLLDQLAEIRARYGRDLPDRVERLGGALRAWQRAPAEAELCNRARELAHRLRGTAGSFGFAAVGEAAGRIEEAVRKIGGAPGEEHAAAWRDVWAHLREAETLAAEARARAGSPTIDGKEVPR